MLETLIDSAFMNLNAAVSSVFFFNVLFFLDGVQLPLVVVWLIAGALYFTFRLRFVNIRLFRHAVDLILGRYDKPGLAGEVSHFKALATALSATVGLGNIAGVAIAVSTGGPGATFWMILAGFLGMSSKFAECTLAQIYRDKDGEGHVLGGPMLYLQKGFAEKGFGKTGRFLSLFFAFLCMGAAFGGGGSFQVNQSMHAVAEILPAIGDYHWAYGLFIVISVGIVIIGGLERIASVSSAIVPIMATSYVLMSLYILTLNAALIPAAFAKIVSEAFNPEALYGGFLGVLVTGFRRASFSNEAGVGSAAIAHSAAKTEYPVQEGIVALLEPFIDTVVICTMTALVIVITGAYNNPAYIDLIHGHNGSGLTSRAVGQVNAFFPYVLCCVVFLFAYSTIISWSYYGERCFAFVFGAKYSLAYKSLLLVVLFCGAISSSTNIMEFGDLMILGMAFPNIVGLFFMREKIIKALADYTKLLKSGAIKRHS